MQWQELRSHIRHLPQEDLDRIERAFRLGKQAHGDQKRKSGEPYFNHPIAVAHMVVDMGADRDTIIAALLHDTVEDTDLTLEEIEAEFGKPVADLINGVTKLSTKDLEAKTSLDQQLETLRKIFTQMQDDVRIMVIKIVDRLHNMQTVEFLSEARRIGLARESFDVYVKIARRLCMHDVGNEMEALCLSVLEPQLFEHLSAERVRREHGGHALLQKMQKAFRTSHSDTARDVQVLYEHPSWEKLKARELHTGEQMTGFSDFTLIFVCPTIDACYATMGALHQLWHRETLSFQDFINAPLLNGYKGLHTTVILEDGTRVRCKMRTPEMDLYAHRGITRHCFQGKPLGLGAFLPWAERISPLTEDTKGRSKEFWESLQSDILGESMIIHGPGDMTVSLPKNATALDGAIYILGKEALRTAALKVNGKDVRLNYLLENGQSLAITLADERLADREWLKWVQTAYGMAIIRGALATDMSDEMKLQLGRHMLNQYLVQRKKGFIEEFDEASLLQNLQGIDANSLEEVFMAVADGHLEPSDVYEALFEKRKKPSEQSTASVIRYGTHVDNTDLMDRLSTVHRAHRKHLHLIQYKRGRKGERDMVFLRGIFRKQELKNFLDELRQAGAEDVTTPIPFTRIFTSLNLIVLFLVWGLDPVFAYLLLHHPQLSPIDLTIIRFWSLTVTSAIGLLWARWRSPLAETRIPLGDFSLWSSAALLFCVALSTYGALQTTLPSHYTIPMTAAGVLLTSIVNRRRWLVLVCTWLLMGAGIGMLLASTPEWPLHGIAMTLLAVASFSAFSLVSERYKRHQNVQARIVQYFFILSLICAVATIPLFSLSNIPSLPLSVIAWAMLFSIFVSGLPYYIYYLLLSHKQIDFVLRYSFIIILTTGLGEMLFLKNVPMMTLLAGAIVALGAILPLVRSRKEYSRSR